MNSRAVLAFARDDPAAVIAAVAPVRDSLGLLAGLEPSMLGFWPTYVHALVWSGQLDEAERALLPYERLAAQRGRLSALGAAGRVRGYLEAARQRPEAARASFESGLASLTGLGLPLEEGLTRLEYVAAALTAAAGTEG
jgi:hypothetical protein